MRNDTNPSARRILLVDDNVEDVILVLAALKQDDLVGRVDVVQDGVEAMEYLKRCGQEGGPAGPAVVLLDLKMPKMDGFEFLQKVRNDSLLRFVPVVIMSASSDPRELARSYALGVNAFVPKHLDFAEFSFAVRAVAVFWAEVNQSPSVCLPHDQAVP